MGDKGTEVVSGEWFGGWVGVLVAGQVGGWVAGRVG